MMKNRFLLLLLLCVGGCGHVAVAGAVADTTVTAAEELYIRLCFEEDAKTPKVLDKGAAMFCFRACQHLGQCELDD